MSPELVLVLRIALLGAVVVGLEFVFSHRAKRSRTRAGRFVQPEPIVRFRATIPTARRVASKQAEVEGLQLGPPIVRLEPLPTRADLVTEKRAA